MRKIESLFNEYGESHQKRMNIIIHYICVPIIFFSLIGLLASIPVPEAITTAVPSVMAPYTHWGSLLIIFGLLYYLRLSFVLFVSMIIYSALILFLIHRIEVANFAPLWIIMLSIFVLAWIGQFIGHKHEGKKPSFIKDLQFLMIGPAWTLSHLFDALKIKY
ncbi:DUF962 domain-containing protein [Sungkyunkwania multivorans]|uniref:DUF962 domain-containing protein n=1 Tax=Sungkyunkwania multivorans TaxID=1173618 RepID=A0ABW3D391_9FLAO